MNFKPNDFSEVRLRTLFNISREKGYKAILFGQEDKYERFILWRHDVDIELSAVMKMASIEYEEGIKATYFFMVRSRFYNLFSEEGIKTVEFLKRKCHQLGLHCDLSIKRRYCLSAKDVEQKVENDFRMLEIFFGKGIFKKIVSFHNPPRCVFNKTYNKFYNTYQKKFFKEIKYLSESNRIWRDGAPEDWINRWKSDKLLILLHPLIWDYPGHTMPDLVKEYLNRLKKKASQALKDDGIIIK